MKIAQMLAAAGLVVASLGVSTAADAQHRGHDRGHRGGHSNYNHNRGGHRLLARNVHQRCRVVWRNHHRARVCR